MCRFAIICTLCIQRKHEHWIKPRSEFSFGVSVCYLYVYGNLLAYKDML